MPKSVLRAFFGRMQFTLHATRRTPHGASRLVQAMFAWLVKTRRVPSRHSRDARVYGHTTTGHAQTEYPPPSAPRESRHKVPTSASRTFFGRMQFTLHATRRTPHGASRLVQAMSACLVKTQRASSRHSRDGRVYGQTSTAMHKLSTLPSPRRQNIL